jgi:DNA-binding response OmpR family regulator
MLTRSFVTMRVLVVEDNPDMGPYLKRGLMEHGFSVDLATDGNEGLAAMDWTSCAICAVTTCARPPSS